jgi:hypothetical protein
MQLACHQRVRLWRLKKIWFAAGATFGMLAPMKSAELFGATWAATRLVLIAAGGLLRQCVGGWIRLQDRSTCRVCVVLAFGTLLQIGVWAALFLTYVVLLVHLRIDATDWCHPAVAHTRWKSGCEVNYHGETSDLVTVYIIENSFSAFTLVKPDSTQDVFERFRDRRPITLDGIGAPIAPGQSIELWGTGLGPIGDRGAAKPLTADLSLDLAVLIDRPAGIRGEVWAGSVKCTQPPDSTSRHTEHSMVSSRPVRDISERIITYLKI